MKKIITFIMFIIIACSSNAVMAQDFRNITYNQKITEALTILENSPESWALEIIEGKNLSSKPIKVKFTNLALLSPAYSNYNALACKDQNGNIYILIDSRHKEAPAEAIACLLTHEVIHQDEISSIEEETQGWVNEAKSWTEMKKINPALAQISDEDCTLVKRLNKLEKMYKDSNNSNQLIKVAVMQNQGYVNLAMASPGFGL